MRRLPQNRLREWRDRARLGQKALAAACQPPCSATTISNLETAKNPMTREWRDRLAAVLGCRPDDLLQEPAAADQTAAIEALWDQLDPAARIRLLDKWRAAKPERPSAEPADEEHFLTVEVHDRGCYRATVSYRNRLKPQPTDE